MVSLKNLDGNSGFFHGSRELQIHFFEEGQFATKGLYINQELIAVTVSKSKCRPEIGFPMVTSQDGRLC